MGRSTWGHCIDEGFSFTLAREGHGVMPLHAGEYSGSRTAEVRCRLARLLADRSVPQTSSKESRLRRCKLTCPTSGAVRLDWISYPGEREGAALGEAHIGASSVQRRAEPE